MKKKNIFKTSEFRCLFITIAEFVIFLIWGLNMQAGDEMAFGLITVYAAIPITAFILCAILAKKNIKSTIILALLIVLSETFLPFFIFGTFEIAFSLSLSLIPCAIGGAIGYLARQRK